MTNEEAKAIVLKALSECQLDVDVTDVNIEQTLFDDEVDACHIDLFNKKSNDLAFKYVINL